MKDRYSGRLRYLEYGVTSSPELFKRPELSGRQVEVRIDGKPVENISTVHVALYNRTDQDFENVPVELTFPAATKIIQARSETAPNAPPEIPQTQPTAGTDGKIRYDYTIAHANRINDPVFIGDYTIEGPTAPALAVSVHGKGVEATPSTNNTEMYTTVISKSINYVYAFAVLLIWSFLAFALISSGIKYIGKWFNSSEP